MAGYHQARDRASEEEDMESFVRRRKGEELSTADARAIWNEYERQAIRDSMWFNAKTPPEVKALARAALRRKHEAEARATVEQHVAGLRGAEDAFTFGLGDYANAGLMAFSDATRGKDSLSNSFEKRLQGEHDQDEIDAQQHATARTLGQVIGTVGQVATLGGAEGLFAPGVRIAQASPLVARDLIAMGGLGGATNVAGQAVSDAVTGHRSTLGDYAGTFAGGAASGVATRFGLGSLVGAVDGATTSIGQDLANGRVPSLSKAASYASGEALTGGVLGTSARLGVDKLSSKAKGATGELLSKVRSWARGEATGGEEERFNLGGGGYTRTDHRTFSGGKPQAIVEAKMGRSIDDLSKRQNQARNEINDGVLAVGRTMLQELGEEFSVRRAEELGRRYIKQLGGFSEYRTDHWLPEDFGAAAGKIPSLLGFGSSRSNQSQ